MSDNNLVTELKNAIKSHPDFPKKGIVFRDFFPILQNPRLLDGMLSLFADRLKEISSPIHCIAGIESRGFLIGPSLALKLQVPFVPIRKPGKLPGKVKKQTYLLEYGSDALEIQEGSFENGQKVVIVDDLIATGGSLEAAVKLVRSVGGQVEQCLVVIELVDLEGRKKVTAPTHSLFQF